MRNIANHLQDIFLKSLIVNKLQQHWFQSKDQSKLVEEDWRYQLLISSFIAPY